MIFQYIRRDWRLKYVNLHDGSNPVGISQRNELWIPNLVFENCVKDFNVKMDNLASLTVQKRGNYKKTLNEELQEENQFLGEANDLVYDRVYKLNFFCDFELHYYPFDKQKCPVMVSNI